MITRRRFVSITCAALGTPLAASAPLRWSGFAFGAEVSVEIAGDTAKARAALSASVADMRRVESLFSLYDPASALRTLNRTGRLDHPDRAFLDLLRAADDVHDRTAGLFDPSVQAVWARAGDLAGRTWSQLRSTPETVTLAPGQQLTFNGIAQGFATDRVTDILRGSGLVDVHVNIGEQAAFGRTRRLGLEDPAYGLVGTLSLRNAAVATSSPGLMQTDGRAHILGPGGQAPRWSTVSVIAANATLADGLSTALCLAPTGLFEHIATATDVHRIVRVDRDGDIRSF